MQKLMNERASFHLYSLRCSANHPEIEDHVHNQEKDLNWNFEVYRNHFYGRTAESFISLFYACSVYWWQHLYFWRFNTNEETKFKTLYWNTSLIFVLCLDSPMPPDIFRRQNLHFLQIGNFVFYRHKFCKYEKVRKMCTKVRITWGIFGTSTLWFECFSVILTFIDFLWLTIIL